jgi:hypothetical protein
VFGGTNRRLVDDQQQPVIVGVRQVLQQAGGRQAGECPVVDEGHVGL